MAAESELARLQQHFRYRPTQGYRGVMPTRVYQCWDCDGLFHLTAFPREKWSALEQWNAKIERQAIERVAAIVEDLDLESE